MRYIRDDGLPAFYFPEFLVRTPDSIYMVETKAQQQTSHPNVQRKLKAAATWCSRINALSPYDRSGREWHYALVGDNSPGALCGAPLHGYVAGRKDEPEVCAACAAKLPA